MVYGGGGAAAGRAGVGIHIDKSEAVKSNSNNFESLSFTNESMNCFEKENVLFI